MNGEPKCERCGDRGVVYFADECEKAIVLCTSTTHKVCKPCPNCQGNVIEEKQ